VPRLFLQPIYRASSVGFAIIWIGTIVGTVTDDTGAVIPDATVTAKNLGTGDVRTVTTGSTGEFTVPNLQIGHYSVTITHGGFASA
jgi:hypothetical protein